MYIYLLDAKTGLPALLERLCSEPEFINRHLPYRVQALSAFHIPLFKIAFEFDAADEVMKGLGVVDLLEMGGLTEMVDDPRVIQLLHVSRMLHKAFIEVNEQGTEAAAVTEADVVMGCGLMKAKAPRLEFVADHPFVFVIREDKTGELLFVGQLLDPLANA